MKNLNDKEFDQFLAWVKDRPIQMRFIELMQTGEMDSFFKKHHLSGQVLADKLLQNGWQLQHNPILMVQLKYSHILIMQAKLV